MSCCRLIAPDASTASAPGEDDTQRSAAAPILEITERFVHEGEGDSAPQVTERIFSVKEGRIELRQILPEEGLSRDVKIIITAPPKVSKASAPHP